jgi:THO complex subunit 1
MDELQRRLQRRGSDDEETIQKRLEIAQQELEQAKAEGFHDKIFINDDLETTFKQLENYIFGNEESVEGPSQLVSSGEKAKSAEPTNVEVEMVDTGAPAAEDSSKAGISGTDNAKAAASELKTAEEVVTAGGETP